MTPTLPQARVSSSNAWIGPFAVLLVCYFLNFALFHLAYPFIPLFLVELGESQSSAIAWTGLGQAVGSLGLMLANPVWGALGDRFGRKAMVLRAMGAGAVTLTIMGLSTNALHLFVARVLQGLAGGSSPALLTLTALSLPRARIGMAMGLMQTAQFLGNSLGPLMGTLAVGLVGFRGTFFMAAAVMIGLVGLTLVAVRDSPPTPPPSDAGSRIGFVQRLAVVGRIPRLRGIVLATLAFQVSYIVSMTLLPLHLYEVAGGVDAPRSVGTVLAASALGGALGSAVLGSLTSRLGSQTITVAAFLLSGAFIVPQVWLSSTVEFAVFRFLADFFGGAVLPALRTLLAEEAARHESTASSMGTVYGVSQSATAGGNALGAVLATAIASAAGIPATFVAAGLVAIATGAAAHLALRPPLSSKGVA